MADSSQGDRTRRKTEEEPAGDPPEATNSGPTDREDTPEKAKEPRRVPGLYGYDPDQWPDAGR